MTNPYGSFNPSPSGGNNPNWQGPGSIFPAPGGFGSWAEYNANRQQEWESRAPNIPGGDDGGLGGMGQGDEGGFDIWDTAKKFLDNIILPAGKAAIDAVKKLGGGNILLGAGMIALGYKQLNEKQEARKASEAAYEQRRGILEGNLQGMYTVANTMAPLANPLLANPRGNFNTSTTPGSLEVPPPLNLGALGAGPNGGFPVSGGPDPGPKDSLDPNSGRPDLGRPPQNPPNGRLVPANAENRARRDWK